MSTCRHTHTPPVKLGMVEALISAMTEEEVKTKSEEKNGSKEPPAQRLYDKEGYRIRVDCVLFRDTKKEEVMGTNVVLIARWSFP